MHNTPPADLITWAQETLKSLNYSLINETPEKVLKSPWSYVIRFNTTQGYIYVKQTPKLIAEAHILQTLHHQFQASVPQIIAYSTNLCAFLMKDHGTSFREILKKKYDSNLFCRAVNQFTQLQIDVSNNIECLLTIGVPDYRLKNIPRLYDELLAKKDWILSDGATEDQYNQLRKLTPKVIQSCDKLAEFSIPETLVQPDFNDNNTLYSKKNGTITLIDLGEIVISHPFLSLLNCLHVVKKHHHLHENSENYQQLTNACLKNYLVFNPKEKLIAALQAAKPILFIYSALAQYRLRQACNKNTLVKTNQQGKLVSSLMQFQQIINK